MSTRTKIHHVSPMQALRGNGWLDRTLEAVAGMWSDRKDIDPVAWQRKVRGEWERNSRRRARRHAAR